jgi:ribosomal protein L37AE/L43A
MTILDSRSADGSARPAMCPFCHGKAVDTQATSITVTTHWRCLECDRTWTIAGRPSVPERSP